MQRAQLRVETGAGPKLTKRMSGCATTEQTYPNPSVLIHRYGYPNYDSTPFSYLDCTDLHADRVSDNEDWERDEKPYDGIRIAIRRKLAVCVCLAGVRNRD